MKKVLTGIGALLVAACGPDFADNGAVRCEQSEECGPEAACYRGFCVADPGSLRPIEVDADGGQLAVADDGGQELAISPADAGDEQPSELAESTAPDASTEPASTPDAATTVTPEQPVATPPAATPTPTPAPTPQPTPTPPATGVPANSKCTLKECCAEAKKAYEERKEHEDEPKYTPKQGKCGCSGPDLINTLTCGLGSLTGLT